MGQIRNRYEVKTPLDRETSAETVTIIAKVSRILTIITPKWHMQIIQSLGNNNVTTHNINFRYKALGNIHFNQNLCHSFIIYEMEISLKGNKLTEKVRQINKDVLIPERER